MARLFALPAIFDWWWDRRIWLMMRQGNEHQRTVLFTHTRPAMRGHHFNDFSPLCIFRECSSHTSCAAFNTTWDLPHHSNFFTLKMLFEGEQWMPNYFSIQMESLPSEKNLFVKIRFRGAHISFLCHCTGFLKIQEYPTHFQNTPSPPMSPSIDE